MVNGLDIFREYFAGYENQYVLIGGTACDVLFESNDASFGATKDVDMVLIVEALTKEFGSRLWQFINDAGYRNKFTNEGKPQFYRVDKPEKAEYPKMLELFARTEIELHEFRGLTPVHIDDEVSSLSAIMLNDDYYKILVQGKVNAQGISVLRPEYLILFKIRAHMDLKQKKGQGEDVRDSDIRKHKNDVLRISAELMLNEVPELPTSVRNDLQSFIASLEIEPFDYNSLHRYGIKTEDVIQRLNEIYKL